jgi:hypothetical protein
VNPVAGRGPLASGIRPASTSRHALATFCAAVGAFVVSRPLSGLLQATSATIPLASIKVRLGRMHRLREMIL